MANVLKLSSGTMLGTTAGSPFGWSSCLFRSLFKQTGSVSPSVLEHTGTALKQSYIGRVETTGLPCDFGGANNSLNLKFAQVSSTTTQYGDTTKAVKYAGSTYDNRISLTPTVVSLGDYTVSISICLSGLIDFAMSMNADNKTNAIHFMPNVNAARVYHDSASFTNYNVMGGTEWMNLRYVKQGDSRRYILFGFDGSTIIDHELVNQATDDTMIMLEFNGSSNTCMFYDFIVLGYADTVAHDKPYVNDDGTLNKF